MLSFDSQKHQYCWDGIRVPAVSDVLNLLFGTFYGSDPEPARRGIMIHDLCQKYLISFDKGLSTEPEFIQFTKWVEAEKITPFEPIETEERFYNEAHGYAGTRDIHLLDRGWIIDIKTGQEQKERDLLQLLAYACDMKTRLFNLYLSPDGWKFKERRASKENFRVFLCGLEVIKYQKKI